jgi:hypothetical protein
MQRKSSDTRSSGEKSEASTDVGSEKKYGTTDAAAAAACQKSRAAEVKNRRLALLQHSKDERTHPSPVKCRRRIGEDTKEAREDCHIPKNPTPPSFTLSAHSFFLSFFLSFSRRKGIADFKCRVTVSCVGAWWKAWNLDAKAERAFGVLEGRP